MIQKNHVWMIPDILFLISAILDETIQANCVMKPSWYSGILDERIHANCVIPSGFSGILDARIHTFLVSFETIHSDDMILEIQKIFSQHSANLH